MRYKQFLIFIVTVFSTSTVSFGEDTVLIKILDKTLHTPIIYAYVELDNNTITCSDTSGQCRVTFSNPNSVLSIKCLGYIEYSSPVGKINNSQEIFLIPKSQTLTEVVIRPQEMKIISAPFIKKTHDYTQGAQLPYNVEVCTFVPLPERGEKKILNVRIKMEKGAVENPVRLHIYDADELGLPRNDLLDSNVIVFRKDIDNDEYLLSVVHKNINITTDKIFIGVEWPGLYQIRQEDRYQIGPRVIMAESISEQRTFMRTSKWPNWEQKKSSGRRASNMLVSVQYVVN